MSNNTDPDLKNHAATETPMNGGVVVRDEPVKKSKLPKLFALAVVAALVVGISLAVHQANDSNKDITIGKTKVTSKQVKDYGSAIGNFTSQHDEKIDGGVSPQQAAQDALVLNAALKDQAQKHGVSINQSDIDKAAASNYQSAGSKQQYWSKVKSEGIADYMKTQFENAAYENKLNSDLIAREQLLWVSINVATPYVDQSSDPSALRAQATQIITNQFLPLFKNKDSKEVIAKQTDQDLVNNPDGQFSYKAGLTTNANYFPNYDPSNANFFNDNSAQRSVPGQKIAADEIAKLKKVGDYTPVFLSKGGYVGIFRLEGKTGGQYTSWGDFLNTYKKQYDIKSPTTAAAIVSHKLASSFSTIVKPIGHLASAISESVFPHAYATSCENDFHYAVKAIDSSTFVHNGDDTVSGTLLSGATFSYSRGASDCGHKSGSVTTNTGGFANVNDNCIDPVPNYSQSAPSGDSFDSVWTDGASNTLVHKQSINDIPWNTGSKNSNPQDRVIMLYNTPQHNYQGRISTHTCNTIDGNAVDMGVNNNNIQATITISGGGHSGSQSFSGLYTTSNSYGSNNYFSWNNLPSWVSSSTSSISVTLTYTDPTNNNKTGQLDTATIPACYTAPSSVPPKINATQSNNTGNTNASTGSSTGNTGQAITIAPTSCTAAPPVDISAWDTDNMNSSLEVDESTNGSSYGYLGSASQNETWNGSNHSHGLVFNPTNGFIADFSSAHSLIFKTVGVNSAGQPDGQTQTTTVNYPAYSGSCGSSPTCQSAYGSGYTGTYPNCNCPSGQTGTPPNCTTPQNCPAGSVGTYPNCQCPSGQTGTPPNCTSSSCNGTLYQLAGGGTLCCPPGSVVGGDGDRCVTGGCTGLYLSTDNATWQTIPIDQGATTHNVTLAPGATTIYLSDGENVSESSVAYFMIRDQAQPWTPANDIYSNDPNIAQRGHYAAPPNASPTLDGTYVRTALTGSKLLQPGHDYWISLAGDEIGCGVYVHINGSSSTPTVTCTVTTNPSTIYANTPFDITAKFTYSGGNPPAGQAIYLLGFGLTQPMSGTTSGGSSDTLTTGHSPGLAPGTYSALYSIGNTGGQNPCGNSVTVQAAPSVKCTIALTPATGKAPNAPDNIVQPGEPFKYSVTITTGDSSTYSGSVTDPFTSTSVPFTNKTGPNITVASGSQPTGITPIPAGGYTSNYSVTPSGGSTFTGSCTANLSDVPYVKVYGGDITGTKSSSTIGGFTEHDFGDGAYTAGSGTSLLTVSSGFINGLVSGELTQFSSSSPYSLTAANTSDSTVQKYGYGGSAGFNPSPSDYYSNNAGAKSDTDSLGVTIANHASSGNGSYSIASTQTLPSSGNGTTYITPGERLVIYVNGDVNINGNICYSTDSKCGDTNWTSNSKVPYLEIVAKGKINIAPNVTELDGIYIAGGTINDCSGTNANNYYASCSKQLVVYGSFIGGHVDLLRTYGTVYDATKQPTPEKFTLNSGSSASTCSNGSGTPATTNCAAEIFQFSPENFFGANAGAPTANQWEAITTLPPLL
ncbi:MAG TPA: hypothetical protein VG604_01005 [Candidatus Saccharimonadales bacterium]|nr:hypothetical protein [Candidatus Saccharimonadales bacterium]